MRILITTDFYIDNLGGVTTSILGLVKGLHDQRHEVKILTLSQHNNSYKTEDEYFIRSYPAFYAPGMRFTLAFTDPLLKELKEWQPDIIHAQSEGTTYTMAKILSRKCDVPLIITSHTDYAYFLFGQGKNQPMISFLSKILGKIVYDSADQIIVPAKKSLKFDFLSGVRDKISVAPNGIEIREYQKKADESEKTELRKKLNINKEARIMVAVSRLSKEKNLQELISFLPSLLKKNPDTVLMIVGEGPYYQNLQKLTAELNLKNNIIFTGRIAAKEVWHYYDLADVFVSASLFEVHSMTYIEAMAASLPLLCHEDDSLYGVLEHGTNGFIYNTEEEFADYAGRILSDDILRENMKKESLLKAEDFTSERFASTVIEVYKNTINTKRTFEKADDAALVNS